MSDANATFYGSNAVTSEGAEDPGLANLLNNNGAEVRNGDEFIEIELPTPSDNEEEEEVEQEEGEEEGNEEGKDKPKDESTQAAEAVSQAQEDLANVSKDLATKGLDPDSIAEEYYQNEGKLSDATLKKLEAVGYTKPIVDAILRGQVAAYEQFNRAVYASAGGEEGFNDIVKFVQANAPKSIASFNAALERGDLATVQSLMDGWKAQRAQKYGTQGRTLKGSPSASAKKAEGYSNRSDMIAAMSDARYGRDPSYTKEVESKVALTNF